MILFVTRFGEVELDAETFSHRRDFPFAFCVGPKVLTVVSMELLRRAPLGGVADRET